MLKMLRAPAAAFRTQSRQFDPIQSNPTDYLGDLRERERSAATLLQTETFRKWLCLRCVGGKFRRYVPISRTEVFHGVTFVG